MIKRRIQNILRKEWELLFTDVNSSMIVTVLPLLIVGQLTLYIWLAVTFGRETILQNPLFQSSMVKLTQALPATANLPQMKQLIVLFINQFIFFLLLIPTMIAISIATFSIVDEKLNGSLEALLATPARTWEILLGKALAGAIPALVMTWLSAGIFLLVISALGWGNLIRYVINPSWFLSLFLLTPGIAMLSFMLGVIASSKAKDARSAQTISLVIIFPLFALIAAQIVGLVWFTTILMLILAIVIFVIDYFLLQLAVRLFQRESILVQWK